MDPSLGVSFCSKSSLCVQLHLKKKLTMLLKPVNELCRRAGMFVGELKSMYVRKEKAGEGQI